MGTTSSNEKPVDEERRSISPAVAGGAILGVTLAAFLLNYHHAKSEEADFARTQREQREQKLQQEMLLRQRQRKEHLERAHEYETRLAQQQWEQQQEKQRQFEREQ